MPWPTISRLPLSVASAGIAADARVRGASVVGIAADTNGFAGAALAAAIAADLAVEPCWPLWPV
jgi:hypothetical protein